MYIIIRLLKVLGAFMERESLLPCSEKHAFRPYPDPVQLVPTVHPLFNVYCNIIFPFTLAFMSKM
jgi:hypothetical protein